MAILEINIPDQYVSRVLEAFDWTTQQNDLAYQGDFNSINFNIASKKGTENQKEYGERFVKQLIKQLVLTKEFNDDVVRYNEDIKNIAQPKAEVPEDII